jgi:hypothetical protein
LAQSCRPVRRSNVVSNLRYTDRQINVFVTAAGGTAMTVQMTAVSLSGARFQPAEQV